MRVRNSLRSAKVRDKNCRVVRRRGRVYVINNQNVVARLLGLIWMKETMVTNRLNVGIQAWVVQTPCGEVFATYATLRIPGPYDPCQRRLAAALWANDVEY